MNFIVQAQDAAIVPFTASESISFLIVQLPDQTKTDRINNFLVNSVLGEGFTIANFKDKLTQQSKKTEGLTALSYKININTPSVLSLIISTCWTGAHENCLESQYNFDLTTGYNFTLDQVITPSNWSDVEKLVCNDCRQRMLEAKAKAQKELGNSWYEKDWFDKSYESQWQEEYQKLQHCGIEVDRKFHLSPDGIGFYYSSMQFLPMVSRNYAPNPEYFYSWTVIKPFLMPSNPISNLVK